MSAAIPLVTAGIYQDISNDKYHSMEGISKSGLDMIANDPASYIWAKNAPRVNEVNALSFGSAVHAYLLEPELFELDYIVAPSFNLRTNQGKADKVEFEKVNKNKSIVSFEDCEKIGLMGDSVKAHPTASRFFQHEFIAEQSIFWNCASAAPI